MSDEDDRGLCRNCGCTHGWDLGTSDEIAELRAEIERLKSHLPDDKADICAHCREACILAEGQSAYCEHCIKLLAAEFEIERLKRPKMVRELPTCEGWYWYQMDNVENLEEGTESDFDRIIIRVHQYRDGCYWTNPVFNKWEKVPINSGYWSATPITPDEIEEGGWDE